MTTSNLAHLPDAAGDVALEQGWNDESLIIHLMGFINENVADVPDKLADYLRIAAAEENGAPDLRTMRKEVGDDLYDTVTNDPETRSRLVDAHIARFSHAEILRAWQDAGLDEGYGEED